MSSLVTWPDILQSDFCFLVQFFAHRRFIEVRVRINFYFTAPEEHYFGKSKQNKYKSRQDLSLHHNHIIKETRAETSEKYQIKGYHLVVIRNPFKKDT